jgi:hypothetical protein
LVRITFVKEHAFTLVENPTDGITAGSVAIEKIGTVVESVDQNGASGGTGTVGKIGTVFETSPVIIALAAGVASADGTGAVGQISTVVETGPAVIVGAIGGTGAVGQIGAVNESVGIAR